MTKIDYSSFIKSLRDCSLDTDSNEYMVEDCSNVICFDDFIREFFQTISKNEPPSSVDTICMIDEEVYLIEFKNGKISRKEKRNICSKIANSLLVMCHNENSNLICKLNFMLVYNEEKNGETKSSHRIKTAIRGLANTPTVMFKLGKYKSTYFKEVKTFTKDEFARFINGKKISCKLFFN